LSSVSFMGFNTSRSVLVSMVKDPDVASLNLDDFQVPEIKKPKNPKLKKIPGNLKRSVHPHGDPLTLSWSKAMYAKGIIKVKKLIYQKMKVTNAKVSLIINRGILKIASVTGDTYQGKLAGSLTLSGRTKVGKVNAYFKLSNAHVRPLLEDRFGKTRYPIAGTANISIALTTASTTRAGLTKNLNGKGSFIVTNGVIHNFDLSGALNKVFSFIKRTKAKKSTDKNTPFRRLSSTFSIRKGVLHSRDLLLDSPAMKVKGHGTVNFMDQGIHFRLAVHPSGPETSALVKNVTALLGGSVPIEIRGTLSHPKVLPDFNAIPTNLLKAPLKFFEENGKIEPTKPVKKILEGLGLDKLF